MKTSTEIFARINKYAIYILLAVALLIGVLTLKQYGESWDELQFFKYADRALAAYSSWPSTGSITLTGNTYDNYGPAYVMLVALGARLLGTFVPLITSDLRHLLYFITYLNWYLGPLPNSANAGSPALLRSGRHCSSPHSPFSGVMLLSARRTFPSSPSSCSASCSGLDGRLC